MRKWFWFRQRRKWFWFRQRRKWFLVHQRRKWFLFISEKMVLVHHYNRFHDYNEKMVLVNIMRKWFWLI